MTLASHRAAARALALAAIVVPAALAGCAGPTLDAHHLEQGRRFRAAAPPAAPVDAAPDAGEAPLGPGGRLEREVLVGEVLRRNPSLEAMRQAWKVALERYPQAASLDDPALGYAVAPRSFGSSRLSDGQRVDLSQRLPFPGKLALRGESALARPRRPRASSRASASASPPRPRGSSTTTTSRSARSRSMDTTPSSSRGGSGPS